MNLFDLNNDILGMIQHQVFLKRLMKHRNEYYNQHKIDVYVNDPGNDNDTYETQHVDNRAPDCIETGNHVNRYWYNRFLSKIRTLIQCKIGHKNSIHTTLQY